MFKANISARRSLLGIRGEHAAAEWLEGQGYCTNVNTRLPGSTDIEAWTTRLGILVQVKTSAFPSVPARTTSEEEIRIIARAAALGLQAWEARVQFYPDLRFAINWRRLQEADCGV